MIRRVIKRMGSIALSALMITSLMVGCSTKNNSGDSVSSDDLKPVELKMYLIGDKPKDFDTVYGKVNEIMKEKDYNLKTGEAIITKGYNLPSKYVIHTVGPIIYNQVTKEKENLLALCYINSLKLAIENNIKTIAFPCISTGEFCFPKDLASKIAIKTVNNFLNEYKNSFDKIVFNVYSKEDYEIYERNIK